MTTASQSATERSSAATTTWIIDPARSLARFSVRNRLLFLVRFAVTGELRGITGTIELDTTAPEWSSVAANIPTASIETGNARRDKHLRHADFFDADRFPMIGFRSTAIVPVRRAVGEYRAAGQLTIKGRTQEVELDVVVDPAQDATSRRVRLSASTTLNRRGLGLDHSSWYSAIGDDVEVTLAVEAAPQAATSGGTAPMAA